MKSINRIILIGNVGNEVETKYTAAGSAIAKFSLATSESWKDKSTGEKQERTSWHSVVAFGKLGEIVSEYVHKGDPLYIDGSIQYDTYTDKEGVKKYSTQIRADNISMLGSRRDDRSAPAERPRRNPVPDCPQPDQGTFTDDEIPF